MSMRRILVAVDETDASRRAARFVEGFFDADDVSIVAVNVARVPVAWVPPMPYGTVYGWPFDRSEAGIYDEAVAHEQAEAEAIAAAQAPQDATIEVVFGEAVEAIERAADDENADLIVVGTNDKGFLQRLFGGSVAQRLARESTRPVLVVP
jgi:nucleotide-binding universal stress UspA family protein